MLEEPFKKFRDSTITFSSGRKMGGAANAIKFDILSDDTENALKVSNNLMSLLKNELSKYVTNVNTDLINGYPEYKFKINGDLAGFYGVSASLVSATIRTAVTGKKATIYYEGGNEYDVVIEVDRKNIENSNDILRLPVATSSGFIPLETFVTIEETKAPQQIKREDKIRKNYVTADLRKGLSASEITPIVTRYVEENLNVPESVRIEFSGETEQIKKFARPFIAVILLAIFLVFAVMASQFESLVSPFIIFTTIPCLVIGVATVYKVTGASMNLYSIVGIVALVGIIVNNGIILVDYTNQLRAKGMGVKDACIEAGRSRFRPILMTTLTTVLGMVPMGFFPGEGGEQMQPIGMTICGGLFSGTILTLFLAPVMYAVLNGRKEGKILYETPSLENDVLHA